MLKISFFQKETNKVPTFMDVDCKYYVWVGDSIYKIKKVIYGGMSKVLFLKKDKSEQNRKNSGLPEGLILKGIKGEKNSQKTLKKLFEKELYRWADIEHDNVTKCIGLGYENINYLVPSLGKEKYALIEEKDGDLRGLIRKICFTGAGFGKETSLQICLIILNALNDIYRTKGLLHLDLKPSNILYKKRKSQDSRKSLSFDLSITDWGISSLHEKNINDCKSRDDLYKTIEGNGTPLYMAPERFNKINHPSVSQDIYSVGLILFELYDGNHLAAYRDRGLTRPSPPDFLPPFENINEAIDFMSSGDCYYSILKYENSRKELSRSSARIDTVAFFSFLRHCLNKDKTKRFQTHQEAINEITDMIFPVKTISLKSKGICVTSPELNNIVMDSVENAFIRYDSLKVIESGKAREILYNDLSNIECNIFHHSNDLGIGSIGNLVAQDILPHIMKYKRNYVYAGDEIVKKYILFILMAKYQIHISKYQQQKLEIEKIQSDHLETVFCITYKSSIQPPRFNGSFDWVCCLLGGPDGSFGEILLFDFLNQKSEDILCESRDIFPKPTLYYIGIDDITDDVDQNHFHYRNILSSRFSKYRLQWLKQWEYDDYKISQMIEKGPVANLPNTLTGITHYIEQWGVNIMGN